MSASQDYLRDVPDELLPFAREIIEFAAAALDQFGKENDHLVAGLIRERGQRLIQELSFNKHIFLQSQASSAVVIEKVPLIVGQPAGRPGIVCTP